MGSSCTWAMGRGLQHWAPYTLPPLESTARSFPGKKNINKMRLFGQLDGECFQLVIIG